MQITGLDHYNIAAPAALLEKVSRFYCDVLGLTRGYRPSFNSAGHWLYAGTRALVHLKAILPADDEVSPPLRSTGWFAHIAFNCSGLAEYRARLDALGVSYEIDFVDEMRQVQLFLLDPAGVHVELNFSGEEQA